jgi:amidophosphoribosyltransferase
MCGIAGLFLKDESLSPQLGYLLTDMLVTLADRGPDSTGIAVYSDENPDTAKLTIQSDNAADDFNELDKALSTALSENVMMRIKDTHAVLEMPQQALPAARKYLDESEPNIRVMSTGASMEIYKEVGLPHEVAERFELSKMQGRHGIGHTRMATESAVTTLGAHPFSTGYDQCLVHNGSLSNHNNIRRTLIREGMHFETENDTEVAAAYLTYKMNQGCNLGEALEAGLEDLDGFYTFIVGTKDGFGVLRDPIACKPAVMAETDQYVAMGSEYRALVNLPGIDQARVWEPEPATVYFWQH